MSAKSSWSHETFSALWHSAFVRFAPPYDRDKCADLSAIIAVPVLLFLIDAFAQLHLSSATEFLLVPPLAVIVYLIFLKPSAPYTNLRSIVLMPSFGAAIGQVCYHYLGMTPWSIAIATLAVLITQEFLRAYMPPALALAVLAMLLKAQGPGYTLGVAIATILVWLVFVLWRRFLWLSLPAPPNTTEKSSG
jgi:CBS-domain-containing membrane protein